MATLETANLDKKFNRNPKTFLGKGFKGFLDINTATAAPIGTVAGGIVGTVLGGPAGAAVGSSLGNSLGKLSSMASESVSNSLYKAEGGLLEYNSGGTHEENPNGGIPVGPKGYPSNKPIAMVEEGETSFMSNGTGYVFSNRIKMPGTDDTFADLSKKIKSKYSRRLGKDLKGTDEIALKSMNAELEALKNQQEGTKLYNDVAETSKSLGGPLLPKLADGADLSNFLNGAGENQAYIGAATQVLSRLPQLFMKPDKVHYERINPELVDYSAERQGLKTTMNNALSISKRNAGIAGNAGQAMNYLAGTIPGITETYSDAISRSLQTENNTNVQLRNTAAAQNAEISMKEAEANAMERDSVRSIRDKAITDIGDIAMNAAMVRPKLTQQYNALKTQAAINNYEMTWNPDGSPSYKYTGNPKSDGKDNGALSQTPPSQTPPSSPTQLPSQTQLLSTPSFLNDPQLSKSPSLSTPLSSLKVSPSVSPDANKNSSSLRYFPDVQPGLHNIQVTDNTKVGTTSNAVEALPNTSLQTSPFYEEDPLNPYGRLYPKRPTGLSKYARGGKLKKRK